MSTVVPGGHLLRAARLAVSVVLLAVGFVAVESLVPTSAPPPAGAAELTVPDANGNYVHCNVGTNTTVQNRPDGQPHTTVFYYRCQHPEDWVVRQLRFELGTADASGTPGWQSMGPTFEPQPAPCPSDHDPDPTRLAVDCEVTEGGTFHMDWRAAWRPWSSFEFMYGRAPGGLNADYEGTIDTVTVGEGVPVYPFDHYPGGSAGELYFGEPFTAAEFYGGRSPSQRNACCHGQTSMPIDTGTGNFWHTFSDLAIPGRGIPISLTRTYNSLAAANDGPFGYGWTHSYNLSLSVGSTTATVREEGGSEIVFDKSGTTFTAQSPGYLRRSCRTPTARTR